MKTKVRYKVITSLYKNAGRRELPCIPTMKHCDSSEKLNKPSRLKNFEKRRLIEVCLTSPPSHNWITLGIIINAKNSVVKIEDADWRCFKNGGENRSRRTEFC